MKKLIFTLSLLLFALFSFSQWTQLNHANLEGGDAQQIIHKGNDIYISTLGGVFKTSDKGLHWNTVNTGFKSAINTDLALLNDTLFALDNGKIYKLVNNNWTATPMTNINNVMNKWVTSLSFTNNKLYVIVRNINSFGLFSSSDGKTWADSVYFTNNVNASFSFIQLNSKNHVYFVNDMTRDTVYTQYADTVKKLESTGLVSPKFDIQNMSCSPNLDTLYYYGESANKFYKYWYSDSSWHQVNTDIPSGEAIMGFSALDDCMFASTFGIGINLYRSTNNGVNWTQISNPIPTYPYPFLIYIIKLAGSSATTEYLAYHMFGDFYYSSNNGDLWVKRNTGFLGLNASKLTKSGTSLLFNREAYGILRSTDNGTTWNAANNGLTAFAPNIWFPTETFNFKNEAYTLYHDDPTGTDTIDMYKFNDGTSTWSLIGGLPSCTEAVVAGGNDSVKIFLTRKNLTLKYYSYNPSTLNKWTDLSTPLSTTGIVLCYGFKGNLNDTLFLFGRNLNMKKQIFVSSDNGLNWKRTIWPDSNTSDYLVKYENWGSNRHAEPMMAINQNKIIFAARDYNIANLYSLIFFKYSADDSTWNKITPSGIPYSYNLNFTDFDYHDGKWIIFSTTGAYYSTDNCATWAALNNPSYPLITPCQSHVIGTTLYTGTIGNGVWKTSLPLRISSIDDNSMVNVYPNPSSGYFNLDLKNFANENITVEIYNQAGIKIKSYLFKNLTTTMLDISDLAQGSYLIKIQSNTKSETKKVMLVK